MTARDPGGPRDLLDELDRWLAATRADAAAAARARERWLRLQAEEDATLPGLLLDLAEREQEVLVQVLGGRRRVGVVRAVAEDFLALRAAEGHDVLLPYDGVASIRARGRLPLAGDRPRALDVTFAEAVAALLADRPRVLVATRDGQAIGGELRMAGRDLLALRLDGEDRAGVAVPFSAVAELALADPSLG